MEFLDIPTTPPKKIGNKKTNKIDKNSNINSRFLFHSFIRSFREEAKTWIFFCY